MRRHALPAVLAAVLLTACGGGENELPAACTSGEDAVRAALEAAPGKVRLDGTPLSSCLSEEAGAGELQAVGTPFVEAASTLARDARRHPHGRSALELGYLVAAAHRGGDSTQGVHSELLRRLDQELTGVDTRTPAFRRGRRAGRSSG